MEKEPKLENVIFFQAEKMMRQAKELTKNLFKDKGFDVTVDQWLVLKKVFDQGECSQIQLADTTFKDPASIKRILDILQEKDLLSREVISGNKRQHSVSLTEKGAALVERMIPEVQILRQKATEGFSEPERYALLHLLKKVNKNL